MTTCTFDASAVAHPANGDNHKQVPAVTASQQAAVTNRGPEPPAPCVHDIVNLRGASTPELKLAADCFGKSMTNDPTFTWVTDGKCPDRVARFFRNVALMALNAAPDRATCWALQPANPPAPGAKPAPEPSVLAAPVVPRVVCIAYEYPRSYPSDWAWTRGGFGRALCSAPSLRAVVTFLNMIKAFDKAKERFFKAHGPFLFICCFGTAPEFQGKGLGSVLMRDVLAYAHKLGVPAYLEANGADSCRFYARNGFQVLQEFRVAPDAPAAFLMANFHTQQEQTTVAAAGPHGADGVFR